MAITSLWHWLCDRHPQGALRSQFLGIHGDRFLVQVGLYAHGEISTPFLTALGSGHSLEEAEDQAQQRLWIWVQGAVGSGEVPGFTAPPPPPESPRPAPERAPSPAKVAAIAPPAPKAAVPLAPVAQPLPVGASDSSRPSSSQTSSSQGNSSQSNSSQTNGHGGAAIALVDRDEPELTLFEFDPEPFTLDSPPALDPPRPEPHPLRPPHSPAPALEPLPPAAPPSPVDLSDIIAQTGIELRRLGWTETQGREYLKTTYGKLSRHHLSDSELLEFLCYLESLPNP